MVVQGNLSPDHLNQSQENLEHFNEIVINAFGSSSDSEEDENVTGLYSALPQDAQEGNIIDNNELQVF